MFNVQFSMFNVQWVSVNDKTSSIDQERICMETKIQVRSFDSSLSPEDFANIPRRPVYAILDNLRSAFNVGSIIRTADCALLERVYLCGITAHPPHKKLDKTSLGAMPYVPWTHKETLLEAVTEVRNLGARIVALELTNQSKVIWEHRFSLPTALVLEEKIGREKMDKLAKNGIPFGR